MAGEKTKAPVVLAPCPTCNGCGRVPAARALVMTLRVMSITAWLSTSGIREALKARREVVKQNTLSGRLKRLHQAGLVERRPAQDNDVQRGRVEFEWLAKVEVTW